MQKLLVVDDDAINLEIIAEYLTDQHYHLDFAHNGQEAWNKLLTSPDEYDAIILDRVMPVMDGMEVLSRIKQDHRFNKLPVIMQTASDSPEEVAEGLAAGAWYYLAKPYNDIALSSIVKAALTDRKNRQELVRLDTEIHGLLDMTHEAHFRFRTPQQARQIAALLAKTCPDESTAAMGLSELALNAIEHGNLGLSYEDKSRLLADGSWYEEIEKRLSEPMQQERYAVLEFKRSPECLTFTIRDMGNGFDWLTYLEFDPVRAFDTHGRGIAMARQLAFSSLEYQGRGNVVVVTVNRVEQ